MLQYILLHQCSKLSTRLTFRAYVPWHFHQAGSCIDIFISCMLALVAGDECDGLLFMLRCRSTVEPLGFCNASLAARRHRD